MLEIKVIELSSIQALHFIGMVYQFLNDDVFLEHFVFLFL
jgi:hypothetical protein